MRIARGATALLSTALLGACATPEPAVAPLIQCTEPRPQVCTMQYAPVCAEQVSGGSRTYSSGCNACADDAVASYLPGACIQ